MINFIDAKKIIRKVDIEHPRKRLDRIGLLLYAGQIGINCANNLVRAFGLQTDTAFLPTHLHNEGGDA